MSRFTQAQREGVLAEARANLSERREPMRREGVERRESRDIIYKTHDDALLTERTDPTTDATTAWIDWIDSRIHEAIDAQ